MVTLRRASHYGRDAIAPLGQDGIDQAAQSMFVKQRIVTRVARPDRTFRRLQPDRRSLDDPRRLAKGFEPLVGEVRPLSRSACIACDDRCWHGIVKRGSKSFADQGTAAHAATPTLALAVRLVDGHC